MQANTVAHKLTSQSCSGKLLIRNPSCEYRNAHHTNSFSANPYPNANRTAVFETRPVRHKYANPHPSSAVAINRLQCSPPNKTIPAL